MKSWHFHLVNIQGVPLKWAFTLKGYVKALFPSTTLEHYIDSCKLIFHVIFVHGACLYNDECVYVWP